MKMDYPKIISRAFHFSYKPKRWLPFFLLDTIFLLLVLFIFMNNISILTDVVAGGIGQSGDLDIAIPTLNAIFTIIPLILVWALARLWLTGAMIHQSRKEKETRKSWTVSKNRIIPMILASIITTIIGFIGGAIPSVGWLVSLVISWMFMFILQAIVIDNLGSVESLKKSYSIFAKNPFDVFVIWLVVIVISLAIVFVFSIPVISAFAGSFITMAMTEPAATESMAFLMFILQQNLASTLALGLIALIGMEISTVLAIKAQTEFYLQVSKKRLF